MNVGILYSGGKDSNLAAYLAHKEGYRISCLITIKSENKHSFMFHTPSIDRVKFQAKSMGVPLIVVETKGEKEKELIDLENAIKKAVQSYGVEGVVTGAVESVYQASRVQKICNDLDIECFNPLWQKDQIEILEDLIAHKFQVIIVGVFAYPLDNTYLGTEIDTSFIKAMEKLWKKYSISPSGEGGEYESFVLDSPLFHKKLSVKSFEDFGEKHSWFRELELEQL
jgi:diphthine-ammonia ligase